MREGEETDWYYKTERDHHEFLRYGSVKRSTVQLPYTGHSGEYQCVGDPERSPYSRKESNKVSLTVSDRDVILESPASTVFEGESVTLRCRHRTQTKEKNAVFYKDGSPIETDTNHQSAMSSENTVQVISDGSSYMCKFEDEESEPVKLKMEPQPKARLSRYFPSGGSVTLTCSVSPSSSSSSSSSSSGWKYFWYRGNKTSEPLTTKDDVFLSNETISVSQGGLYWCRGGRGDPLYYTEYSDPVVTNRAVVTLRPNWPEIYYLETIALTCELEDGGDAEWEYEWTTSSSYRPEKQKENMIRYASSSYNGDYRCVGTLKHEKSSTEWSDAFTWRVSDYIPRPVLTVSPLWLSPGASVTLNCSVEHPSAGWRFFWYKAVPKLSDNSYSYELIPGSIHGTEQDSYIVDGQTHTAGYVCRAGRRDPVYYTHYSEPKFVWSGDSHSAASLTVNPDRMQHFSREPVSLSCEGNSTEWRVNRFSEFGRMTHCSSSSSWGTMTGSRCNMDRYWQSGVYWCESETGQFSNAVNITKQDGDIILVSPVHPVTEGDSVTLGCKLRTEKVPYNVDFYKNDKLIQNVTGGELTISAVSKSDEGFYKCTGKKSPQGRQSLRSPESWMSVKSASRHEQSPPFPVLLIVGPVCGVLLILLLLLFVCLYRKSKDSCFVRSQSSSRGPATDHMINQDETQLKEYAPPLHGDAVLYESIKGFEEPEHGESSDVTYSVVELKNIAKKGNKKEEPEESAVYSDVKIRSATDNNVMYAQVNSHSKAKKDKGKSRPAAADETVYSEVKPGKALDQ
ncbi:Fc receptor-like protein 5 isoform X9 [Epinephelus moara]|uniref:Fc receptor-like protein 5 isoform X9 n=1 Tax=Epinephelus moara TaxID=300413 RepID=UPI00214E5B13|nr:Fc receptor-like protein 5 isoform X9 [Epinephelus moara]